MLGAVGRQEEHCRVELQLHTDLLDEVLEETTRVQSSRSRWLLWHSMKEQPLLAPVTRIPKSSSEVRCLVTRPKQVYSRRVAEAAQTLPTTVVLLVAASSVVEPAGVASSQRSQVSATKTQRERLVQTVEVVVKGKVRLGQVQARRQASCVTVVTAFNPPSASNKILTVKLPQPLKDNGKTIKTRPKNPKSPCGVAASELRPIRLHAPS